MNESEMKLPGRRVIAAALRAASERLIRELNAPSAEAPQWNEFEWRAAIAVSVIYGVTGLLAERLRWRGPPLWQDFLAEQLHQGVLREQRVRGLLARLDAAAKAEGVPLMALKGSVILDMGLYGVGVRPQSDIDLLCRPQDEAAATRVIESVGYLQSSAMWKHAVFEPEGQGDERLFGEHISNPHKIELHTRIAERLPYRETGVDIWKADAAPGLNGYADRGALLQHLLLHAAGNISMRSARLIQLHDIALLCRAMGPTALSLAFGADAAPWWVWPPLLLAERCFPGSVEAPLLEQAAVACPDWLRWQIKGHSFQSFTVADLRISPLPALAWSRSLSAVPEYVWRQLRPDRMSRQHRLRLLAHDPVAKSSSWAGQPQWLRVMRLLLAPPPRHSTMYSLHTACSYTPATQC